jgi:hypothetical protein
MIPSRYFQFRFMPNKFTPLYYLFFTGLVWVFPFTGAAGNLVDVYSNSITPFDQRVKNITASQPYASGEVEMVYSFIPGKHPHVDYLNTTCENLGVTYLNTPMIYENVLSDLKTKLEVYNLIAFSENNRYESKQKISYRDCKLERIETRLISAIKERIWLDLELAFQIDDPYARPSRISLHYWYEINTSKKQTTLWETTLPEGQQSAVWELLSVPMAKHYLHQTKKTSRSGYTNFESDTLQPLSSTQSFLKEKIRMNEVMMLPLAAGISFCFPAYSQSSVIYGGEPMQIFIPFTSCMSLCNAIPSWAWVKNLPVLTTTVRKANPMDYNQALFRMAHKPELTDILESNGLKNYPKKCSTKVSITYNRETYQHQQTRVHEFNRSGEILHTILQDEKDKKISEEWHDYNALNQLIRKRTITARESPEWSSYTFNKQDNLIEAFVTSSSSIYPFNFFYHKEYYYKVTYKPMGLPEDITIERGSYSDTEYSNGYYTYVIDASQRIEGVRYARISDGDAQYGYNTLGLLEEVHADRERNNTYNRYDSLGRFIQQDFVRDGKLVRRMKVYYEGTYRVPYRLEDESFENTYHQWVNAYEWQFFD